MRTLIAAALAAGAFFCAAAQAQDHGQTQQAQSAAPVFTPDAMRADLDFFRTHVLAADQSYSRAARADAEARLARLEADLAAATPTHFMLELARIAALADNGHTGAYAGPRSRLMNRVDLRLVPFGEDFYVLRAKAENADLLGARLEAIDTIPLAELRARARALHGGVASWRDRNLAYALESPEQLRELGFDVSDAPAYRFRMRDGSTAERTLAIDAPNPDRPRANADRWLYPAPVDGESDQWRTLIAPDHAPWAFRDPDTPFRWREAPEIDALIIQLRQNNDAPNRPIAQFLEQMNKEIERLRPTHVVLDLRMNGGGDLNTTRAFVQGLPRRAPGRIIALTSAWTFSAAISTVGYLKQAAPARVVIVGEPVGDRLVFWAEGPTVTLPNSRIAFSIATERHDYRNACRDYADCHGSIVRAPIAVASLAPDIPAPWTIDAYIAGRDPAIEAIAAAIAAQRRRADGD